MLILARLLAAALALQVQPEPSPKPDAPAKAMVTIRVVDEKGQPVKNALVGSMAMTSDQADPLQDSLKPHRAETHLILSGKDQGEAAETGALGLVTVSQNSIFYGDDDSASKPIIAWTKDHALVGLTELARPCPTGRVEVKLVPACRLEIKATSTGLEKLGRKLTWSNTYVRWNSTRPMSSDSRTGDQLFFVPPGEYKLNAYGADTDSVYPPLTIAPGETTKTLTLDLPACRIVELIGKPAPELTQIKGWANGDPVKLADLRGKVVLLDFWGWWCGPCVHSMPELVAMHEQYKDKGLVVIAVHDDSAADIAEMQTKLERAKREIWGGKDLPFLIALDGGGKTQVPGRDWTSMGATTAAYGINSFPTQVLIDKDGNVAGLGGKRQVGKLLESLEHK